MNEKIEVKPQVISPLKKICMSIGELPTSYLETMTYYEMLVWFTNYLRDTVIPVVNNNGEAVTELQNLFVELQEYVNNYFDNLDVQEEINNKLDEMAESGELSDIIAQYLGLAGMITFDTVAEMKLAENLVNGSKCQTLGYRTVNDGGKALYKVRTITNEDVINDGNIIALSDNTLIAELVEDEKDVVNVLQWGAYPDGLTDNTTVFNTIIDYCNSKRKNIFIPKGNYVIESDLHDITASISIYGNVSGAGQFELKTTIIDNRTSSNYLFNFPSYNTTGGIIKFINFKNMSNLYINKCIKILNAQCYEGVISNCNFYQYGIAINIYQSHGVVVDKCSFIKCGSGTANSNDFAIYIYASVDVSLINLMVDHTRFQLYVDNQSYVYVTNSHFELSTVNIVAGKSPIYCEVGLYGHVMFDNCSIIGLSYKYWMERVSITAAQVPFMVYGTYIDLNNCILSCGSGSGEYSTTYVSQCKFVNTYYGTISNCKIKSPSYLVNSFNLPQSKMVNCHVQCDIEATDYASITKKSRIVYSNTNKSHDNVLQFILPTLSPQTYPDNYPVLYNFYSDHSQIETNKGNIKFSPRLEYAALQEYNTLRIQSDIALTGVYKLKAYSTGQASLLYEGYFRINNKALYSVSNVYKNFGGGYSISIFSDDGSNDLYIQFNMLTYRTNALIVEIEGLENHQDVIMYYDPSINSALTYTNKLDITA